MLDTETTGLSPQSGDRMVEIGAIEVSQRHIQRERKFHRYINPGRPIPDTVVRIHGIDDAKVKDKPSFADIAPDFLKFIEGATLVIHNAPFDLAFIMHELAKAGLPNIGDVPVVDTLLMARKRFPHQRNTLDALCDRHGIERGHRILHGALLDAELLAEMYLAMTGGNQFSLGVDVESTLASSIIHLPETAQNLRDKKPALPQRKALNIHSKDEEAHKMMMQRIDKESKGHAIWLQHDNNRSPQP
ncbi:MAG: DNA polymerase III subunit epsilon [Mariprofundaceae bacterium]|nr:DNA polymerase III subunit epsilon [Mariprofundaceae bacterium]